jgi:hypothetical protein
VRGGEPSEAGPDDGDLGAVGVTIRVAVTVTTAGEGGSRAAERQPGTGGEPALDQVTAGDLSLGHRGEVFRTRGAPAPARTGDGLI